MAYPPCGRSRSIGTYVIDYHPPIHASACKLGVVNAAVCIYIKPASPALRRLQQTVYQDPLLIPHRVDRQQLQSCPIPPLPWSPFPHSQSRVY